ncbi:uncharacterized protein LOC113361161 [Papaver somniferum]|uniref:uncharacterized protein LOC113361161 n=1 Tax=Papaver somniferum TaxID=3469 RepID=UPI000E7051E8|nr:uncharacterized protein LOC113361161 [Papaver somniferum]
MANLVEGSHGLISSIGSGRTRKQGKNQHQKIHQGCQFQHQLKWTMPTLKTNNRRKRKKAVALDNANSQDKQQQKKKRSSNMASFTEISSHHPEFLSSISKSADM